MKIYVTKEQFSAIKKLRDECVLPFDIPDEDRFIEGMNEILGDVLVDRMMFQDVQLVVREWSSEAQI